MNKYSYSKAMGKQPGDYIVLENKWARVVITREESAPFYTVVGDVLTYKDPNFHTDFRTIAQAMAYALRSLALYQAGRAS